MTSIFKKISDFLFSTRAAGFYILLFAVVIAIATFIENDFGTSSAQELIYRTKWFELLLLLISGTIITNIFRFKMIRNRKWGQLIFHIAIILIFLGAGITRYFGYEGMMNIREGSVSNYFLSSESYLQFKAETGGKTYNFDDKVYFSTLGRNHFNKEYQIGNNILKVSLNKFLPNPTKQLISDPKGKAIVKIVIAGNMGRDEHFISKGEITQINGVTFNFNDDIKPDAINLKVIDEVLNILPPQQISRMVMATQTSDTISTGKYQPMFMRAMYQMGDFSFVAGDFNQSARIENISTDKKMRNESSSGLELIVQNGKESGNVFVTGNRGQEGKPQSIKLGDINLQVNYGAKPVKLPFSIGLRDFIMERYPGTDNPSSYASEVTLMDPSKNVKQDYRIYMNHILNYGGYRFFQSSFDRDEMGTYLSVNHDYWGTLVSYLGYGLLTLGMFMVFFAKNSRFNILVRKLNQQKSKVMILSFVILSLFGINYTLNAGPQPGFSKSSADELGTMVVQDFNGRFKPLNTLSREVLRKMAKKESLLGMTSDQAFWSMMKDPMSWENKPIINLGREEAVKKLLDIKEGSMASFSQFFTAEGKYKLQDQVSAAQNKMPKDQNAFDKALLKLDERVNIAGMIFAQQFLRIFPVPGHENNSWISPADIRGQKNGDPQLLDIYAKYVDFLNSKGEGAKAFKTQIYDLQEKNSGSIMPSQNKIKAELLLNKINVFNNLMKIYGLLSLLVLAFFFYSVLWNKPTAKLTQRVWLVTIAFFCLHTFGIILRWYVSGRAPWSNGYESMVYISWSTMLAGLLLSRKSLGGIAATLVLTATILSVAAMSWLDPEITPLVPVLKSYWLTIHVALIAGSYGFLLLGAFIGVLNLILMILSNSENKLKLVNSMKELTTISEIILIVGLVMLSIGTYLGGVWANESWGRYWGWDAKETWALVTVLVYSFILHMRLIPGLNSLYSYNFASLFGFATVIMTFFGVNYYLSGMHSYAAGDPVPIPPAVYFTAGFFGIISALAYFKYSKVIKHHES